MVHQEHSPFGTVFVVDEGDVRTLRFDSPEGHAQSMLLKSNPLAVPASYVRVATAGLAFTTGRSRALVVGLGGGAFPLLLGRCLPRMVVDVVELNPVVVDVARRFFGVRDSHSLRLHVEDGAHFMRRRRRPGYDIILLDAFSQEGTPEHLQEPAFFEDVLGRLAPGGAAVINIALDAPENKEHLFETFARTFAHHALLRGASESANLLGVGALEPMPSEPVFRQHLWRLERELGFPGLSQSVTSFEPST